MKKEIKKIVINFRELNKKCDSDYQKLYDKLHDLELSHNRKWRLLNKIAKHWDIKKVSKLTTPIQIMEHTKEWVKIVDEIEIELNSMHRTRMKHKKIKKEPSNKKPNLRNIFQAARMVEEQKNEQLTNKVQLTNKAPKIKDIFY